MKTENIWTRLTLIFVVLIILEVAGFAQPVTYYGNKPTQVSEYINVQGSPYLFDDWATGSAAFEDGKLIDNMTLKYNIKDDEIYFKNSDGDPMSFGIGVKSFTLIDKDNKPHVYRNGYTNATGITSKSYLEVIVPGKAQFLKKYNKSIIDNKEYASGITNRRFIDNVKYYIYITPSNEKDKPKTFLVKKDKNSILQALNDKDGVIERGLITKFIDDKDLNLKKDEDIIKVVNYYNSL